MTIRTKYVNGMNEIKADKELKQRIINKINHECRCTSICSSSISQ